MGKEKLLQLPIWMRHRGFSARGIQTGPFPNCWADFVPKRIHLFTRPPILIHFLFTPAVFFSAFAFRIIRDATTSGAKRHLKGRKCQMPVESSVRKHHNAAGRLRHPARARGRGRAAAARLRPQTSPAPSRPQHRVLQITCTILRRRS